MPKEEQDRILRNHIEELLDAALKESFPASDVPAISVPDPKDAPARERRLERHSEKDYSPKADSPAAEL